LKIAIPEGYPALSDDVMHKGMVVGIVRGGVMAETRMGSNTVVTLNNTGLELSQFSHDANEGLVNKIGTSRLPIPTDQPTEFLDVDHSYQEAFKKMYYKGSLKEAQAIIRNLLLSDGQNPHVYKLRAQIHMKLKLYHLAGRDLHMAGILQSTLPGLRETLLQLWLESGKIKDLKTISKEDRMSLVNTYLEEANNAGRLAEYEMAVELMNQAVNIAPDPRGLYSKRSRYCLAAQKYSDAEKDIQKEMTVSGKSPELYSQLAQLHGVQKLWQKVVDDATAALKLDSAYVKAYTLRARARLKLDKWDTNLAYEDVNKALTLESQNARVHLAKALVLEAEGDKKEALKFLASALKIDPNLSTAYVTRIRLKGTVEFVWKGSSGVHLKIPPEMVEKTIKVLDDCRQALQLDRRDYETRRIRAIILLDLATAISYAGQHLELLQKDPQPWLAQIVKGEFEDIETLFQNKTFLLTLGQSLQDHAEIAPKASVLTKGGMEPLKAYVGWMYAAGMIELGRVFVHAPKEVRIEVKKKMEEYSGKKFDDLK